MNDLSFPPERRHSLVFAGEAIVDLAMNVPALPPRGGIALASSASVAAGGGFNVMAAAARQGLPVLYAGGHGTGPWGDLIRAAMAAEGIGVLRPPDPAQDTGLVVALAEPGADAVYVTHLGAEIVRGPDAWDAVPTAPGDTVYVSGFSLADPQAGPALSAWAAALPPEVLLLVDPGPLTAQITVKVLAPVLGRCDWLSCNHVEAEALADAGLPRPGRAGAIVRAGADGCYVSLGVVSLSTMSQNTGAGPVHVPAPTVTAVDTTGAGDAHVGAFLAALADGLSPLEAAARANAAAALAVTRQGPATAPTRAELDAWLQHLADLPI
jgi:sugar/nucleoside kinase (ribokinase family)